MNTTNETAPRMIGLREYAERNGINRHTAAYWCQKGMLKGVVKQPDVKGGAGKYIYLIPENARIEKETTESVAEACGMLTIKEYARQNGCNPKTVAYWCCHGLLQGAVKKGTRSGRWFWMVPKGAHPQKPYTPKEKPRLNGNKSMVEEKRPKTEREISQHLIRYCGTRSYKQLAEETGKSVQELKKKYDHLHERLGI